MRFWVFFELRKTLFFAFFEFRNRETSINCNFKLKIIIQAFTMLNLYASVWILVAMTFDRYFAVCNAVKAMNLRNHKNLNIVVAFCWGFAAILTLPGNTINI